MQASNGVRASHRHRLAEADRSVEEELRCLHEREVRDHEADEDHVELRGQMRETELRAERHVVQMAPAA